MCDGPLEGADSHLRLPLCLPQSSELQELYLHITSLEQVPPVRKHTRDITAACNNIKNLRFKLGNTDLIKLPCDWIPDFIEHFHNVQDLSIETDTDLTETDWSDVQLPHLQALRLQDLRFHFSSLQQILSCSKSTLRTVRLDYVEFVGGTFAHLFSELDTPKLIALEADCCSLANHHWTEHDQEEGKLFCDRMNTRRLAEGCVPTAFYRNGDDRDEGELYATISLETGEFENEIPVCFTE
jgi:hypothetical protein